jgi:hypothetical protein
MSYPYGSGGFPDPNTSPGDQNVPPGNVPVSRYGILPYDLRINAMTLSIGDGQADRFNSPDAMRFVIEGELWAEQQISGYIAVPLQPIAPQPGLTSPSFVPTQVPAIVPPFPPSNPTHPDYSLEVSVTQQGTKWQYPYEFIQACIFLAISKMLKSEFFEVEPNTTQASLDAEGRAMSYLFALRRSTILVGAGRRRNTNAHLPPNIAPVGTFPANPGFGWR